MAVDVIDYKIHGDNMQILEIELDPGEGVQAETGAMVFMTSDIKMQTGTGGFFKGLKRKFVGENFFITTFEHIGNHGKSHVGFAAPYPGRVIPINLHDHRGAFVCQKDAFLACARGIDVSIHFNKKLSTGFFGGEGFILQKLQGVGLAFVHAGGNMISKTLGPGEKIRVDTGCVLGFTHGVDFSIEYVGGFMNPIFGGEGAFVSTLTGPGIVVIQSMPFQRVVDRIETALSFVKEGKKLR